MNTNGASFFGSDWLGAFLIIAILFGGNFGLGGGRGPMPDVATKEFVADSVNNQATQTGLRDVLLSSANNNYETAQLITQQTNSIMQKLDQLGFTMESCCSSIKTQMLQDKYEALENQFRSAQNDISNNQQTQYILGALGRYVTNPPVAVTTAST